MSCANSSAAPFLKWAGGKSQLLDQLAPFYPPQVDRYLEPFLGGGAVFFHLHALRAPREALLTDSNPVLIDCYQAVRDHLDALIPLLEEHRTRHTPEHYYAVRALDPVALSLPERAARFIYLNKTCFNGLYRVNAAGRFNVPLGRYRNPSLFTPENLRAVGTALRRATLRCAPFTACRETARAGDFIYFDPPYHPLSETARFTAYTSKAFGPDDQRLLADLFRELDARGCRLMLSNSDCPFIWDLYQGYRIERVWARRAINSNPGRRGPIPEVLVLNYDPR